MVCKKVSVIEKGKSSGVTLTQGVSIIGANSTDTSDNIVNVVRIYDEKGELQGKVQNKKSTKRYGIFQKIYEKESGIDAKKAAQALLQWLSKSESCEAPVNTKAISGDSIKIDDKATGLSGTFYIVGDSHRIADGVHTMRLDIVWKLKMEKGAESEEDSGKIEITNEATCYYLEGSSVYHSSQACKACMGKVTTSSTVEQIKQIYIQKGKNKGKRKYKPCSKGWYT